MPAQSRHQIHRDGDAVTIFSDDGADHTDLFPEIAAAIKALPAKQLILDVDIDDDAAIVSDILWDQGGDIHAEPSNVRLEHLGRLKFSEDSVLRLVPPVDDEIEVDAVVKAAWEPRVPTSGPVGADVMFVGASPGEADAARKEPFVGQSGETLNELYLKPLGITRAAIALTNAVPQILRGPGNVPREPSADEVKEWRDWLVAEITRLEPRVIVALGRVAEAAVESALGRTVDIVLPHPTAVRRFGNSGEVARKLKRVKDLIAERRRDGKHVVPMGIAIEKAPPSEEGDETRGEAALAHWDKSWHEMLPRSGKGRWVFQHHWRGLSEDETRLTDKQLMQTDHSVHGDLRFEGEDGLWGWAVLIGGTEDNRKLPHLDKLIDFKPGDKISLAPKLPQPDEWLDVGVDKPLITVPGEVDATSQKFSKFFAVDSGTYELGVARQHAQEIFLDGRALYGRYMLTFAPVADQRRWLIDKPEDQTPVAERSDLADVIGELKRKRQRYLIWGKPGQASQKIDVMTGKVIKSATVPLLKELTLEDKRIVYGVVLDPYIVDAHNDWVPPEVVEETAHGWFKGSRLVTLFHKTHADATAVESSIEAYPSRHDYAAARLGEPHRAWRRKYGEDAVHSGAWIIGVQLSTALWDAYKKDEIGAFSIEGFGMRTPASSKVMPDVTFVDLVELKNQPKR